MISSNLPALQVVIPLLGAVLAALVRRGPIAWFIALVVSWTMPVIAFALLRQVLAEPSGVVSYALGGWAPPLGIEYRVDLVSAYILILVSLMGALVITYAPRSVASEIAPERQAWFYTMYLLCMTGLLGIAITGDAFNAFVFLEVSSLSTYVLIALGRDRRAVLSAYQYLIVGTIGATFYVLGVGLLYVMTGTLNLADIASRIGDVENIRPLLAALAFITVGISLKVALFPLHLWLPNAYAFAPSVVTIFLASTATKVAIYLLLRYLFSIFGVVFVFDELPVTGILIALSVAAMIIASIVAIFQVNVKRMLAYSSIAQIGYITLGIALATQSGLTGGIVHIFNHAVMKAALFMAIGCIVFRTGAVKIEDLAGIGRRMPLTMGAFVIAGLGLIGVPGTVGFVSKYYLVLAALEQGLWWLAAIIVISSLIAVVYIGRVIECAWFREPAAAISAAREPPLEMLAATWVLTAAIVYLGFDTQLTAGIAARAAEVLLAGMK
jgi:multicomponent Na+:H+ antiporter subunit D